MYAVCLVANVPCVHILCPVGMCADSFVRIGLVWIWAESEGEGEVEDGRVVIDVLDFRLGHELGDFDSIFQ